ncbi:hypothetical protein A4A49_23651 [Nicotiana attenuata]|uniref:GAG-pre-integrase domain-containing protein n=1 Tax=Nicotiana attenuata TaxID=49451 RepID=A0A1J6I548_NICAT|nr:hypothetical protein A4A49_23651 [Nicotiana attenuata]
MASNTISTASLHHLIASCPVKLKPSNYLIWRTQMMQLIQVIRLNYLIEGKPEIINIEGASESSDKDSGKEVDKASDKKAVDDWAEKDVLLRSWISGTIKVINFARGLGPKYKTFRTVMLGKAPYPTLSQLVTSLRGFDLREDEEDDPQQVNHNMAFAAQRTYNRGRGSFSSRRGNMNYNSRVRAFRPAGQNNNQNTQESGNAAKDFSYQAPEDFLEALATLNVNSQSGGDNAHYMDSGASTHMTNNSSNLSNLKPYNGNDKIVVGNGQELDITHVRKGTISGLRISEVLVVPKLKKNLLSISKITRDNCCSIVFDESFFVVTNKRTGKLMAMGSKRGEIYALKVDNLLSLSATQTRRSSSDIWHARLGHLNSRCFPYLKGKHKFSPKSYPCVYIGYNSLHKGYRYYHPTTRKVFVSRHVVFDELTFPYVQENKTDNAPNDSRHMATFFGFFSESQAKSGSSVPTAAVEVFGADHDTVAANVSNDQDDGVIAQTTASTTDHSDAIEYDQDEAVEVTNSVVEPSQKYKI